MDRNQQLYNNYSGMSGFRSFIFSKKYMHMKENRKKHNNNK